jgi:dienelactone hydrolase
MTSQLVHWIHRAVRIDGAPEPYDTAHVSIYYPAGDGERVDPVGTRPVDTSHGRLPLVILLPGMNTELTYYRWLAMGLARRGFVVMTSSLVSEVPPHTYGITPGVDISAVTPDTFGSKPVGRAIAGLLRLATAQNADGVLTGAIDLDNVALVGHSAGGTVALESANAKFFPEIKAVVSYASHTMASTVFGWPPGSLLPLSGDAAVMIFSANRDGLVAASAKWYGKEGEQVDPIAMTFDTLPATERSAGSWFIELDGANHFSILQPQDFFWPRADEDWDATLDPATTERFIEEAVGLFLRQHLRADDAAGTALTAFIGDASFVNAKNR